ncbi:MAG TPA: hypothetical protein VN175_12475, partial [Rhizomicrobium sp.]|nr:hypothetical protein [Rhizomicrobium sp.]
SPVDAEESAPRDKPAAKTLPRWQTWGLAAGLMLALASALVAWQLWPAARPAGASIAVLPFVNLSGDASQEFFSDGITEEITAALAKIPDLPVVGRTSAFQYKGKTGDLRVIGRALNASYVLEGSVRKAGDRIRITAQLVSTATGDHIWTDSYDRQFKDVFALQEEVAQAIAGALRVPLGLRQGEQLVSDRTTDTNSYQDYLRARALFRARNMAQAIPLLEQTVARDPGYAPAWAMLARAYVPASASLHSIYNGSIEQASLHFGGYVAKASHAARQALRLDPRDAAAHAALAQYAIYQHDWETGRDEFNQALALDPNDPDTLVQYASAFLGLLGYTKQEFSVRQKVQSLEPFVPVYNREMAITLVNQGQTQAAIDLLQQTPRKTPGVPNLLAFALSAAGRFGEAADLLMLPPGSSPELLRSDRENAIGLLRTAPQSTRPSKDQPDLYGLNWVYLFVGAPDRALADPEREVAVQGAPRPMFHRIWSPAFAPARKTERFKTFVRNAGMVDYWRTHGWPDLCHPVGQNDFACN